MNKLMTVAVIDSGIYPHIDFKNRIVAFKDFVNGRKNAYDDCGHGTHVSGIIAGSGYASHGRIKGICPAARLAGIKVLDRLGNGRIENVLDATDWIISHQKLNIRLSIYPSAQPHLAKKKILLLLKKQLKSSGTII
ncbi:MAG: S8 family serine peptidase [Eubacterium sp.]